MIHAKDLDYQGNLYRILRESTLNSKHNITPPYEGKQKNSKNILKNSELVITEFSFHTTGRGIELGWADMLNVPIIYTHKKGTTPAGSLKFLSDNFTEYSNPNDMISKIELAISSLSQL